MAPHTGTAEHPTTARKEGAAIGDRTDIGAHTFANEARLVGGLLERTLFTGDDRARIMRRAMQSLAGHKGGAFGDVIDELGLSPAQTTALMQVVADAARIRDARAAGDVVAERLKDADAREQGEATRLSLSAAVLEFARTLAAQSGGGAGPAGPILRAAVARATNVFQDAFLAGPSIEAACARLAGAPDVPRATVRLAGLVAYGDPDAERNTESYVAAAQSLSAIAGPLEGRDRDRLAARPALLVKLSDLHPRYRIGHGEDIAEDVAARLVRIASSGAANGINVLIEAEGEALRDAELAAFATVFVHRDLADWHGLGLTVSPYSKRAIPVLRWLRRSALTAGKRIPLRLSETATDWQAEIAAALAAGRCRAEAPVFTDTDVVHASMTALVQFALSEPEAFYAIVETADPVTLATMDLIAPSITREVEHPFGAAGDFVASEVALQRTKVHRRVGLPVGTCSRALSETLRGLLRSASDGRPWLLNAHRLLSGQTLADPLAALSERQNAGVQVAAAASDTAPPITSSLPLFAPTIAQPFLAHVADAIEAGFGTEDGGEGTDAAGLSDGDGLSTRMAPHDRAHQIGSVIVRGHAVCRAALEIGAEAFPAWEAVKLQDRAARIAQAARVLAKHRAEAVARLTAEAGLTVSDALLECDTAANMLSWIGKAAPHELVTAAQASHPAGNGYQWQSRGRGLFLAITPHWRPLSTALVHAGSALAAGNTVALLPPPQLPFLANLIAEFFHEAGIPEDAVQALITEPATIRRLVGDDNVAGISYDGPRLFLETLKRDLIADGRITVPFVAESLGRHAAIVDPSADFDAAADSLVKALIDGNGQTSATPRIVLTTQNMLEALQDGLIARIGALKTGAPSDLASDLGPLIDQEAADQFDANKMRLSRCGAVLIDPELPDEAARGAFVAPALFRLARAADMPDLSGPAMAIVAVSDDCAAGGYAKPLEAWQATQVSLFAQSAAVIEKVRTGGRYGQLNVNTCATPLCPALAPAGTEGRATAAALATPGWFHQFAQIAVTARGAAQ